MEAQTLGMPAPTSGDCATAANGSVVCTRTNGAPFAGSATTDTTNAANIATGTLPGARLPVIPLANLQPLVMDTAGLLGLYRFDESAGNLLDYSGNGNDGVVSGSPMSVSGTYYYVWNNTQVVTFPAALNASNTYYFVVHAPATAGGQPLGDNNYLMSILGSTAPANTGLRINGFPTGLGPLGHPGTGNQGVTTLSWSSASAAFTWSDATAEQWTGSHVIALSCPAGAPGTFYLDGVALANASGSASCNNIQTGGNFKLGPSTNAAFYPFGLQYWAAAFYSTADSSFVVSKRSGVLRQYALAKGAPFPEQPQIPRTTARMAVIGDSIACGYGLTDGRCTTQNAGPSPNAFPFLAAPLLNNSYAAADFGVPSAWVQDNVASSPTLIDQSSQTVVGQDVAVLQSGTNNMNQAASYAAIWGMQQAWAGNRARAGERPLLMSLISRGGSACNGSQNCDSVIQAMNAVQRAGWKATRFAAYVDLGSDPLLGATGASTASASSSNCTSTSPAVFFGDNLHLCGGHTRMAQALACVVNGLDGTNAANMGGAALTASTALGCADGGRSADPTAGAVTLSLWSAMWQTGREIGFCNVSSSTANALTLTAPADFPFSNVSGRTTVTVAPNSCARFRATFNGNAAAPGNFWMQL